MVRQPVDDGEDILVPVETGMLSSRRGGRGDGTRWRGGILIMGVRKGVQSSGLA